MNDVLELTPRSAKPRERGVTHVIDGGLSLAEVDGMIEVAGEYVDIVKLGWGTALVVNNLEAKLGRYRECGIPVVLGGTLTELAMAQGRLEYLVDWIAQLGIERIEISDGTLQLEHSHKLQLIEQLSNRFTVLSEVGSKDASKVMAPYRWIEQITTELSAGAWKVIAEARECGNAGIFRPDGEVRTGLIDEIVRQVDPDKLIFEAPRREQQAWFIKRLGPDVNLGNIAPSDVISLETLRLGLRADTAVLEGEEAS